MRFIDSNVIAYSFYNNLNQQRCQEVIREGGFINTLVLIEAFNIISSETNVEHATKSIKSLLKSNLEIVEVDVNTIFDALKNTIKYKNLKFIDLVHYITALNLNCIEIFSYDRDFDNLDIKRVT